ncbi:hypothetical protein PG988_004428 [Apiospora saccharicola]
MANESNKPSDDPVVGDPKARMDVSEKSQPETITAVDKNSDSIKDLLYMARSEIQLNSDLKAKLNELRAESDAERARNQRALEDAQQEIAAFRAEGAKSDSRMAKMEADLAALRNATHGQQPDPYRQLAVIMATQRLTKGQWDKVLHETTGKLLSDEQWERMFPEGRD